MGVVDGAVDGSWKEKSACGFGVLKSVSTVLTIAPMQTRSNTQYGVFLEFLGISVTSVAVVASGGRRPRERGDLY